MVAYKLQSSDGKTFDAGDNFAKMSGLVIRVLNRKKDDGKTVISVPHVSGVILEKIILWTDHHKNDTGDEDYLLERIPKWDLDFMNMEQIAMFELIQAAYYLDIKGLMKLSSKILAIMFADQTSEQLRQRFNIKNDFSAEEQAEMNYKHPWYVPKV